MRFLSTPSARRATPHRLGVVQGQPISIHALREEGDLELYGVPAANIRFLSTPSARRATLSALGVQLLYSISILALREESDIGFLESVCRCFDFYPRPPRGGRHRAV